MNEIYGRSLFKITESKSKHKVHATRWANCGKAKNRSIKNPKRARY